VGQAGITSIADYLATKPKDRAEQKAWLANLVTLAEKRARELKLAPGSSPIGPTDTERDAAAGVPPLFATASLDDFPELRPELTRLYPKLMSPADDARYPGLLICGEPGRGKTRLGCALVRAFVKQRKRALFTTARHLQRKVWDSYTADGADEQSAIRVFTHPDLLVIDDLGHEGKRGDASLALLLDVFDERANHRRATVVTTNLTGDEVESRFDGAMYSRLAAYDRLVIGGPDQRRGAR
jgi:hypothetical protein